jgi:hypothetical protein
VVTTQKYDQMEALNDQLMNKLRSLTKRYQEREEEFDEKCRALAHAFEESKAEVRRQREQQLEESEALKGALM